MSSNFEVLTQINLDDLVSSFGWQDQPLLARPLRNIFLKPAQKFARHMVDFDSAIAEHGLPEAARLAQRMYIRDLRVFGADLIPAGPFLALSNHPGMTDTLSLFAALKRRDLKVIALDRPFLNALPNMSKQLFYVKDDSNSRMALVRQVSNHLRNGGAVLTFPAGHIEPDPHVYPGAVESLKDWTDSVGVFIRMAPQAAVLPILVRGVVDNKSANHPLLKIRKTKDEREKLAAALQLLGMVMFNRKPASAEVHIGRPICAEDLGSTDTEIIHQAVVAEMKRLIENSPQSEGEPLL